MKFDAVKQLRAKLAASASVYGLWVTMESTHVTELAVACGLDFVVVCTEHGALDWRDVSNHIKAAVRSRTCVFVRIATSANIALDAAASATKRALDIGADGLIYPNVETPAQLHPPSPSLP